MCASVLPSEGLIKGSVNALAALCQRPPMCSKAASKGTVLETVLGVVMSVAKFEGAAAGLAAS